MPFEEIEDKSAPDTVTTLPTLYVVVTQDTVSGGYQVSGSYMVTSGITAESSVHMLRDLYRKGTESLGADLSVGSANEDSQQEGEGKQRSGRTRVDIESSFDRVFPAWKSRHDKILATTPGMHYRSALFKAHRGTQWKVVTEEEWEAEKAGLEDGVLITHYALDGWTLESAIHVAIADPGSSQGEISGVGTT